MIGSYEGIQLSAASVAQRRHIMSYFVLSLTALPQFKNCLSACCISCATASVDLLAFLLGLFCAIIVSSRN